MQKLHFDQILTVGSVGAENILSQLNTLLLENTCDLIELRLDLLQVGPEMVRNVYKNLNYPILLTPRCSSEGGAGLDQEARIHLIEELSGCASAVDIEIANLKQMQSSVALLKKREIPLIASSHDFSGIPSLENLRQKVAEAKEAEANVAKFAVTLSQLNEIEMLVGFLQEDHGIPVSLMGMGSLGAVSRVIFAQYGSVLNYGYLGNEPTAPGQWSAQLLKEAITASVDLRNS